MRVDDHEHGRGCFVDHGLVGLGGLKAFLLTRARAFCFICGKYMLSPRFFAHRWSCASWCSWGHRVAPKILRTYLISPDFDKRFPESLANHAMRVSLS